MASPPGSIRELRVASDIAQAFLAGKQPIEVYRLALERIAPLVDASLGCVFLREDEGDLLRIVAAYNWPQRYAEYLDRMRVRIGNGPTGRAVANDGLVEVSDVFADPELEDWWEPARELGFVSSVSIPLRFGPHPQLVEPGIGWSIGEPTDSDIIEGDSRDRHRGYAPRETPPQPHSAAGIRPGGPVGALTFYFREKEAFAGADRSLLRLVATQIAATAEKAHLIEDLQRANQRLRQQNVDLEARYREAAEAKQVKNELLANVSHELRTPLTAILGYAYLLKDGIPGQLGAEQEAAVTRIEHAGGQLLATINGLLDLTNLKLNRVEVQPELCDAVSLARAAMANAPATEPGVELRMDFPLERLPIHTDPALVLRVLHSLISNAFKFTSEGTVTFRVRVRAPVVERRAGAHPRGSDIVWEISDTGIGVAPEDQELIFQEFRQVDGSATRRYGGAGLGLAIARAMARRLGGEITVTSAPGQGATFSFSLPSAVVRAGAV